MDQAIIVFENLFAFFIFTAETKLSKQVFHHASYFSEASLLDTIWTLQILVLPSRDALFANQYAAFDVLALFRLPQSEFANKTNELGAHLPRRRNQGRVELDLFFFRWLHDF
jgi:hypothetical protein